MVGYAKAFFAICCTAKERVINAFGGVEMVA
jgi:hypothetical protein